MNSEQNLPKPAAAAEVPRIRAVILDFGMVLCNAPSDAHIDRVAQIFGMDHAAFWRAYDANRLALDRGDISPDEYWTAFASGAGRTLDPPTLTNLKLWDIEMWLTLNDPMVDWVERLGAAGFKLGLLSNLHQTFATYLREHADWLRHFNAPVFSAEVRRTKPDPEIYRHILARLGVRGDEALFVDDRQINVDAARAEGIYAIQFESVAQLRQELLSIRFEILP